MSDTLMVIRDRTLIFFGKKLGWTAKECFENARKAFPKDYPSERMIEVHYKLIDQGMFTLVPKEKPGRTLDPGLVKKVNAAITQEPYLSLRQIAEIVGSNKDTVRHILEKELLLKKRYTRWIPHELNMSQKKARVAEAKQLLEILKKDEASDFQHIVTGDESWMLYSYPYDGMWLSLSDKRPEVPKPYIATAKSMLIIFWGVKVTPVLSIVEKGQTVTAEYFIHNVLEQLDQFGKEREIIDGPLMIHMDNAPAHRAKMTKEYLETHRLLVIPHPPYSPDLAPSDFFLFGYLKMKLRGKKHSDSRGLLAAIKELVDKITPETRTRVFREWMFRLEAVIASGGEYY
jgi:transposase